MPKPFSLQSPENIAKEYGGNKQKIAQAMQMGLVDPTAGTLAGMFIDRMRGAQMQEGSQQPTVAQQVFAPPAPPAPMGAPPAGGMPPTPPMGAPPMGAPPMGGMPPAPPMGMANGGVAGIPLPDSMFDEPQDSGFAGGGIVAFAQAGEVDAEQILRENMDYYRDPQNFMRDINAAYQPKREYAERANQFNKDLLSEEGQKKRRDEDKYFALAQLGATMASTPGSLLQAASAGIGKALPGLQEANKERRAEVRDALKQLAADENMTNAEQRAFVLEGMKGRGEAGKIAEGFAQRKAAEDIAKLNAATDLEQSRITAAGNLASARETSAGYGRSLDKQAQQQVFTAVLSTLKEVDDLYAGDKNYSALAREYSFQGESMPAERKKAFLALEANKQRDMSKRLNVLRTTAPPGAEGAFDRALQQIGGQAAGSPGAGSFREGQMAKDRQGRPIVLQQGKWVYAD
jgi:hypothetical protein